MFKRHLVRVWIGITLLSCMFLMGQEDWSQGPKQPGQEGAGPGDDNYICDFYTGFYFDGNDAWSTDDELGDLGGYIYAPSCAERPEEAPVVFFYHMALGDLQVHYEAFHRHLAAKGYIVIAPNYHRPPLGGDVTKMFDQVTADWVKAGVKGAKAGLEYYEALSPPTDEYPYGIPAPLYEEGRLVYGAVGHSFGTAVAAALANPTLPSTEDPPPTRNVVIDDGSWSDWNPKAVVMMSGGQVGDMEPRCPGWMEQVYCTKGCLAFIANTLLHVDNHYWDPLWNYDPDRCPYKEYVGGQHCMATDGSFLSGDLSAIDYNPLWIVMGGEADWEGGETPELQAYCKATSITDKHYLRVRSDDSGQPPLKATHTGPAGADLFFPIWTDQVDAHDYWAYWKVITGAMNCKLRNPPEDCDYWDGTNTTDLIDMGEWSDGEPVKKMQYNPKVRDHGNNCYSLEEACDMVREDTWKWRGGNIAADCDPND